MGKPVAGEVVVFLFPQTNLQSSKLPRSRRSDQHAGLRQVSTAKQLDLNPGVLVV